MAKKINLLFLPDFEQSMLTGKKTATTRTRRFGHVGDWFFAFGKTFVLIEVYRTPLTRVVYFLYQEEGFNTPQELIACWNGLHPDIKYEDQRDRPVYVHQFQPVQKGHPQDE
jgi:hypothetical protein